MTLIGTSGKLKVLFEPVIISHDDLIEDSFTVVLLPPASIDVYVASEDSSHELPSELVHLVQKLSERPELETVLKAL